MYSLKRIRLIKRDKFLYKIEKVVQSGQLQLFTLKVHQIYGDLIKTSQVLKNQ